MVPHPYGPANEHVLASKGADTETTKFYITEYSSNHGQENFSPRNGKHVGAGYKSNIRPGVYYSRNLDELDNPTIGRLLEKNYISTAKDHFQAARGSNGKDPFSNNLHMVKSGFVKDVPRTLSTSNQVNRVYVDTKQEGTVYPRNKPTLHLIRPKDPVEEENNLHGPRFMSTENHTKFNGTQSIIRDTSTLAVGPKEGSGFTHAQNVEPITYRPNESFEGAYPRWFTWRPTGSSVMKSSFQPSRYSQGDEPFKKLDLNAERDSGYTREGTTGQITSFSKVFTNLSNVHPSTLPKRKKDDPAEFANMVHSEPYPSMTSIAFSGNKSCESTVAGRLGRVTVGNKESTGYTDNNHKYLKAKENAERFDTHYQTRFYDKNTTAKEHVENVNKCPKMPQLSNGFTKSTQVQKEADLNTAEQMRKLHPYVARSINARDVYYDDHTHENKHHQLITT